MTNKRVTYNLMGLPFDKVTLSDAVSQIENAIDNDEKCFLSTPNLNFVMAAQSDDAFFHSVTESDLIVADGMPLIWVAKLLGLPIKERVAGSTLFKLLKERTEGKLIKVFFFGGEEGVAEKAHRQLNDSSCMLESCGYFDPGFVSVDEMSSVEIINEINESVPDFIIVALGAKKGQAWIRANNARLRAPVISHLGAVINFEAGKITRSPERWQNLGLEWLWRIKEEPSLWQRYWVDGLSFGRMLFLQVLPLAIYDRALLMRYRHESCEIEQNYDGEKMKLFISGSLSQGEIERFSLVLKSVFDAFSDDVVIDCLKLRYIDSAIISTLLLYQSQLNHHNRRLLLQVSSSVKRILSFNNVFKRFEYI